MRRDILRLVVLACTLVVAACASRLDAFPEFAIDEEHGLRVVRLPLTRVARTLRVPSRGPAEPPADVTSRDVWPHRKPQPHLRTASVPSVVTGPLTTVGSHDYAVDLTIGTPPQRARLVIDTGSSAFANSYEPLLSLTASRPPLSCFSTAGGADVAYCPPGSQPVANHACCKKGTA